MKKVGLNVICVVLLTAIIVILIWYINYGRRNSGNGYEDGIQQIDLNSVYLEASGVEVSFSDIILSKQEEKRKLIVGEQTATVSTDLTDRIIQQLDFDFLKKTQKVSYTGKGYFVVDLDNFTKDSIIEDENNKVITLKIDHAYLESIVINPDDIIIDEVKEGLLARGDIKLTVSDYNFIEQKLLSQLEEKFNTAENGQKADVNAIKAVKEVYEPLVKAIDGRYSLVVEFR